MTDVTPLTDQELFDLEVAVRDPLGAKVTRAGFVWTSLIPANVWEPTDANSTLWQKGAAA